LDGWIIFLFTNQDWIKLLGSKRKKLILFYGCGKAIDEAQVIFISVNTPTKTYGKEKGWQPI
jgi:hypothetical protein